MMQTPPIFLGYAVFGTADGLMIQGNGVFLDPSTYNRTGIFEFDIGRSDRGESLHVLKVTDPVIFRRRVVSDRGEQIELLGLVSPCRDSHSRRGFFGTCVAIHPDQTRPEVAIYSWQYALDQARRTFNIARSHVDNNTHQLLFPHTVDLPRISEYKSNVSSTLYVSSGNRLILYEPNSCNHEEALDRFQAIAFSCGEQTPTIFLFGQRIEKARSIMDPEFDSAVNQFQDARLKANAAKRAHQTAKDPEPAHKLTKTLDATASVPWSERPEETNHRSQNETAPSPFDQDNIVDRVHRLEEKTQILQKQVQALKYANTFSNSSFKREPSLFWSKILDWVIFASIALLIFGALAFGAMKFLL